VPVGFGVLAVAVAAEIVVGPAAGTVATAAVAAASSTSKMDVPPTVFGLLVVEILSLLLCWR